MEADFANGDTVTHSSDEDDYTHTSSLRFDDISGHSKAKEVEQGIEENERTQTRHQHTDIEAPRSRKRIRVDDEDTIHCGNTIHYGNEDDHSHRSLHHSPHGHVHKRTRNSPPSASMRFYKRSLSLALQRARRQPITRSLTTRLTRSGAKFFKHDLDSNPPSPSSRSTNLHLAHRHTATSYGSRLHSSSKRSNIIHATKRASPSKIDQNFSPEIASEEDALQNLNEDIAIRYLNSSPSFYALLDLDFDLDNELLPSTSPLPDANPLYLGPEMDVAIKYDNSSPKIYTLFHGIDRDVDLDSPTPSRSKASFPKVKDSPVRSRSSADLKCLPRTRVSSSSSSPTVHNLQDHHDSRPRSPSSMMPSKFKFPSKFKLPSGKPVDRLFSSRSSSPSYSPMSPLSASSSPSYSPMSPMYASSSQDPPRSPPFLERPPHYSPTSSYSNSFLPKSDNHLFSSRSSSPKRFPISPAHVPSPPWSSIPKGTLPCIPPFKHSSPRTFKLRGSPSRSPSKTKSLMSPSFKSSPRKGFWSRSSTSSQSSRSHYGSPRPPTSLIPCSSYNHLSSQRNVSPRLSSNPSKYSHPLSPRFTSSPRTSCFPIPPASSSSPTSSPLPRCSSPLINNYNLRLANSSGNKRSPSKRFNAASSADSHKSPQFTPSWHNKDSPQTSLGAQIKYSDNLHELVQSLSAYWSPVEKTSSPPYSPTSNAGPSSLDCWPASYSPPPIPCALNRASSRGRSPSISSQGSPTSTTLDDYWSQVRPTYSLFPSSPRKPSSNDCQSSLQQYLPTPVALTSNSSSTGCSSPHAEALKQPDLNLYLSCRSRLPSPSGQGPSSDDDFWSQVRGKPSLFSSSSPQRTSRSRSPPTHSGKMRSPPTSYSPQASLPLTHPTSPLSSTQSPFSKRTDLTPPVIRSCSTPCQRHVTFATSTNRSPGDTGQQRVNIAQNNQSRPYRKTPHPNYLQQLETYLRAGSSETLGESSSGSPSIEATSVRPWGRKSSNSSVSLGNKEGALPLHSHDLQSLRSQSWFQGVPSHNLCRPTTAVQETYYSAQSTPSSSHTSYYSAQSMPSPSFYHTNKGTMHRNFDHYPLISDSGETARSQSPWLGCSQGSYRSIPSASANKMYGDYNRTCSPASSSSSRGNSSRRSPSHTAMSFNAGRSSRKRPYSGEAKGTSKLHRSY